MIVVMVLSLIVQQTLTSRFKKYSKVGINLSGAEVSARMMADNGINDVRIGSVNGQLTDHYDPSKKAINLSDSVYAQRNIAAAVAAHETGHCLQHAQGYAPLKFRSAMVPVVSFANNTVQWVLLAGVLFINVFPGLLWIGIALFALTTIFSFVTLPDPPNGEGRPQVGRLHLRHRRPRLPRHPPLLHRHSRQPAVGRPPLPGSHLAVYQCFTENKSPYSGDLFSVKCYRTIT